MEFRKMFNDASPKIFMGIVSVFYFLITLIKNLVRDTLKEIFGGGQ